MGLDLANGSVPSVYMKAHSRALVAATTFALVTGKNVAGVFDHASGQDHRIAAQARGNQVQGVDGDRSAKFGGTLPEIFDGGDRAYFSFEVTGDQAKGYDRGSAGFFEARVDKGLVQVFDHAENAWFAFDIQDADAASSYYRESASSGE